MTLKWTLWLLLGVFWIQISIGARAVEIDSGHGAGAIYVPLYSAHESNASLLSISSDSPSAAIKVLFEDINGNVAATINLYLTDSDSWVMSIGSVNNESIITIPDSSCTVPNLFDQPNPAQILPIPLIGRIVIIDMGQTDQQTRDDAFILHDTGLPRDCQAITDRWSESGVWRDTPNFGFEPPWGRLTAQLQIINVPEGTSITIPATNFTNFSDTPIHQAPELPSPDLSWANNDESQHPGGAVSRVIKRDGSLVEDDWENSIDAIAALLVMVAASSSYTAETAIGATAEWVFSSPLRRFYSGMLFESANLEITLQAWDRDGKTNTACGLVMPCPHMVFLDVGSGLLSATTSNSSQFGIPGQNFNGAIDPIPVSGRLKVGYVHSGEKLTSPTGNKYFGFPVIGIAVQKYVNGQLNNGKTLANYQALMEFDPIRSISNQ